MIVTVNGEPTAVAEGATVADVVGAPRRGVAVARNGEVVPRSLWDRTGLEAGDLVEILTAAQGG